MKIRYRRNRGDVELGFEAENHQEEVDLRNALVEGGGSDLGAIFDALERMGYGDLKAHSPDGEGASNKKENA